MNDTRDPGRRLRGWAASEADEDMLRHLAFESAKSALEEAAAAYAAAYGDEGPGFLAMAKTAWTSR